MPNNETVIVEMGAAKFLEQLGKRLFGKDPAWPVHLAHVLGITERKMNRYISGQDKLNIEALVSFQKNRLRNLEEALDEMFMMLAG